MELFKSHNIEFGTPLAEKLRPTQLDELMGQENTHKIIKRIQKTSRVPNMILWGPPGTGKTSFANALIRQFQLSHVSVNAIDIGAKALKEIGEEAKQKRLLYQVQTVVFIDEIHRLNKAQQDVLLPFIEKGDFVLIGATTENPSYDLNKALLSRCELVIFNRLSDESLLKILKRGINFESLQPEAQNFLIRYADGDGRKLLMAIETILSSRIGSQQSETPLTAQEVSNLLGSHFVNYDAKGDQHYDVISAFIKSIRGSDADAALYYLARMLEGGEDPIFIARRLVILASEDVGNADPKGLGVAVSGAQAVELVGLPEAAINLAQVVTYLASAPKSNRSYLALKKAQQFVKQTGTLEIPLALRSAQTESMKNIGYGKGYLYPHDFPKHYVEQNYLPEKAKGQKFYEPSDRGFEKQIKEYQDWLKKS